MRGHRRHGRAWLVLLIALVVVVVHVGLFRLLSRTELSRSLLIIAVAVLVLKYVWWKRRR